MARNSDILQSEIVRGAMRGWEANLDGRSRVEQSLTRAIVVGHQLLGVPVEAPTAERFDAAFDQLDAAVPGLFATWENSRGTWLNVGAAPPEVVIEALRRYLLQALGTHDPQNLGLAKVLLSLAMEASMSSLGGPAAANAHARVPVALLIDAAYQAEAGYVEFAGRGVDMAIQAITNHGELSPVPGAAPTVLAVCKDTRKQVRGAFRKEARLTRWHYEQEAKAKEFADRAVNLFAAGQHGQARSQIELALETQKHIAQARPGHPGTHELDAYLHGLRARILVHTGQAGPAVQDAMRSMQVYQRLTTYDRENFAGELDLAHQVWVEITMAASGGGT